jgi:Domain of unknown function (DUF4918)
MKTASNQAEAIIQFLKGLKDDFKLPGRVEVLNPFRDKNSFAFCSQFYRKFYSDQDPRYMIFGINPGRFGGGITGIPFTDPVKLQEECGIPNAFKKVKELSADFVYRAIAAFGGPELFYKKYYITAISPLGFTLNGKNLNYYDNKDLIIALENFIVESMIRQLNSISTFTTCFCLGEGSNYRYFQKLNQQHLFFKEVIPLPHPRWIMQYRRKKVGEYIEEYMKKLNG